VADDAGQIEHTILFKQQLRFTPIRYAEVYGIRRKNVIGHRIEKGVNPIV
jgi:hypothetical protein